MITLTIEAADGEDLRRQLISILGNTEVSPLAIAAGTVEPIPDPEPVAAPAKATRSRTTKTEEPAPTATEQAGSTEDQTPQTTTAAATQASESTTQSTATSEPEKPATKPAAKVEPASDALADKLIAAATNANAKLAANDYDFDRDTAPFIIATVKAKDPMFVHELLQSQFDVEKVSHLPDERHPEVLNALADKLAA